MAVAIALSACGSSKIVRASQKVIKGNWTLRAVTYSEAGTYNVTLLNDATKECFEGSTWQFVPNNNTGIYSINEASCPTGDRYFLFTIQEVDQATGLYDFLLKPTNEKYKSEKSQGFRLTLAALTDNLMVWQQTVSVDGKPFIISMNFDKQQ